MKLEFHELVRYTQEERDKWRAWFTTHPEALGAEVQPAGRYATVGTLIDHIFLVERRHLQRLRSAPVDTSTGLSGNHAAPLFDYGASVRRELDQLVSELDEEAADETRTFTLQTGDFVLTPRKLLFHCLLHETRHWAQVALAVRRAGLEPPGNHDLLYSKALK